ncbi:hypothetical protein F383_03156 [Gossypium arboreum]|uniref:Uncharacterized protein n=1 Tax=Gossypium arboreum TaxID=29729 RepID=A0A0B0P1J0_GOSAR|nr:hypothetical protein F383_03156 [Gossypium arboreum]
MSLGLPFWSSSYICYELTTAHMSLPIFQLFIRPYRFSSYELTGQLDRPYRFSLIELTVHQLKRSLPIWLERA